MLISSAGLWIGALVADHLGRPSCPAGPLSRHVTSRRQSLERGDRYGVDPWCNRRASGTCLGDRCGGPVGGEGAPTSRRSCRGVGARRRGGLHRRMASAPDHRLQRCVASLWPSARSPPACRGIRRYACLCRSRANGPHEPLGRPSERSLRARCHAVRSVGEGAPTSRRSRREVGPASGRPAPRNGLGIGPSPSALRRQRRAVVRSPPACRALALVIRGRGMERPLTHQPVRGAASRRAWPRRKGAKAHAGRR